MLFALIKRDSTSAQGHCGTHYDIHASGPGDTVPVSPGPEGCGRGGGYACWPSAVCGIITYSVSAKSLR